MKSSVKRVSIRDLARELGISDRAVSAALNPSETKVKLKRETAERIRKLAAERNYRPDTSARSMRSGRFFNIGYFEAATSPVHYPLLGVEAGVCDVASERGYRVVLVKLPSDLSLEHNTIPSVFREAHVDALIVSHLGNLPQRHKEAIDGSTFPIIYLNEKKPKNAVYVDDVKAARDMTIYLQAQGYRKIVFLYFEMDHQTDDPHYSLPDRKQGYEEAMTAAGLKADFKACPEAALERTIKECPDAEVFMCWDDLIATRVLKVLYRLGRRVPDEIGITGFGDGQSPMDLTTMQVPFYQMARKSVEMSMELIGDPDLKTVSSQVMNAEIVAGETIKHRNPLE